MPLLKDGIRCDKVTISTTELSPDVESYLRRIIPSEEMGIGPTDFGDTVIGGGSTTTEIMTEEVYANEKIETRLLSLCILLFSLVLVTAGGRGKEIGVIVSFFGLLIAFICGDKD